MDKKFIINTTAGGLDVKVINENTTGDSREDRIIYCIKTDKCRSMHMTADSVIIECTPSKDDKSEDIEDGSEEDDSYNNPCDEDEEDNIYSNPCDEDEDDYSYEDGDFCDEEDTCDDSCDKDEDCSNETKDNKSESVKFTRFRPKKIIWGTYKVTCEPTISIVKYNLLEGLTDDEKSFISDCIHNAYYRESLINCFNCHYSSIRQHLVDTDNYNKFDSLITNAALLIRFSEKDEKNIKCIKDIIHEATKLLRCVNAIFNAKHNISKNASNSKSRTSTGKSKSTDNNTHSTTDKGSTDNNNNTHSTTDKGSTDNNNSTPLKSSYDTVRDMIDFVSGTAKVIKDIINETSPKDTESNDVPSSCTSCKSDSNPSPCTSCKDSCNTVCGSKDCTSCKSNNTSSPCISCKSNNTSSPCTSCKSNNTSSPCTSCKDSCKEIKSPRKDSRHKSMDCSDTVAKRFSESARYESTLRTKNLKRIKDAEELHSRMKAIRDGKYTSSESSVNSSNYIERISKDISEIISMFTELDG